VEEWVRDGSKGRLKLWGNLGSVFHSFHGPSFSTARFRGGFRSERPPPSKRPTTCVPYRIDTVPSKC
jgi:hypothetical protein